MAPNNKSLQDLNDELISGIADLRRQISDLKASNAFLHSELASLQSAHRRDIAELRSQISDLKAADTSLESQLLSSQSAPYKDIADLWDQITLLNSSNIMLESQLSSLQSDHCRKSAEVGSQISGLQAFDAFLETHVLSLRSSFSLLAGQVNDAETELFLTQKNLSQMLTMGARMKEEMREGKMRFMVMIRNLEDRVNGLFMKNNAMVSQQIIKHEGDNALQHALLVSTEFDIGSEKINACKNLQDISTNDVQTQTIIAQVEENQNQSKNLGAKRPLEGIKKSNKFTFWAVLTSIFVVVGSLAYVVCTR